MKRRWKARVAAGRWPWLDGPIVSGQVAAAIRAESRAAGLAAADERMYWQRRAVADRASAVARFHEEATVRVSQRDVERAQLEGQLACLRMLDAVDQKTATAISSLARLHAEMTRPFEPASPEMLRAHANAQRQLLAAKRSREEEVFFAKPRRPDRAEADRAAGFFTGVTVAPTGQLTRERLAEAFVAIRRQGHDHAVIKNVTGF